MQELNNYWELKNWITDSYILMTSEQNHTKQEVMTFLAGNHTYKKKRKRTIDLKDINNMARSWPDSSCLMRLAFMQLVKNSFSTGF